MPDLRDIVKNLYISVALLVILYVVGTIFYHKTEGWSYLNCIYFITITIATVGYGDLVPTTDLGKMFTVFIILIGVSIFLSLVYSIAAYRERTVDQQLLNRLSILRNLTSLHGARHEEKKKPKFIPPLGRNIGEI
jgi:hypothetical protein